VVKNTLAKRALERVNASAASVFVEGAIVLVTTDDDPQPVSKALVNFAKDKEAFELKGAFLEGAAQNHEYVKALAALPSKDELITKVVCGIKSPITGFVLTLNAITKGFVVALNEIRKKKESS